MRTLQQKLKKTTAISKGRVILLGIGLAILGAIAGGFSYWQTYRKHFIRAKLEKVVSKKSEGLYALSYDSLKLDEVAGNLSISNVRLVYDSNRYLRLLEKDDAPPALLKISIPLISVNGVKTPQALLDKEIIGSKLVIKNPTIDIIYTNAGKDSARNIPTKEVYRQLLGDLNLIKIDTLEIFGADVTTRNIKNGKKNIHFDSTNIRLLNVAIDETPANDRTQLLFAKHLEVNCQQFSWTSGNKLYNYSAHNISLNSASNSVSIKRFSVDPVLAEQAFVKSLPAQDDRFDFVFNDIAIQNVNFQQLLDEVLLAENILVNSSSFKIYRDLSIPRDKKNRVGRYPHQLLKKIPLTVDVKKLVLSNSFIEYKEKSKITGQAGKVQFHNVQAILTNLTNDEKSIRKNNIMNAVVNSQFLNTARLNTNWQFHLQHPRGRFDLEGSLAAIEGEKINPLIEPLGPAKIEKGQIEKVKFDLTGNNHAIDGDVVMLYNDLKVALLERDKESKELDKKSLTSFIANIAIKNDNPSGKNEEPRTAKVRLDRDSNRSIFYLVWKAIFKGVKESAGIKK
ncbi:hypothetical protein [Terrimonas alba]|uniref:hypothetical protein n=1 Tax=Terrimonas alba TaxID=3349636 RepID=UPI0035F35C6E